VTKLIKLAGVRYNPETGVIKMSCENFEAPAQNKRYLGDTINRLVTEARSADELFEDVPLDFRHSKGKKKPVFPEGWKVTPERTRKLRVVREGQALLDEGSTMQDRPSVDGGEAVYEYVRTVGRSGLGERKML
jgi:small subunit ribosomal protein S35